MRTEFDLKRNLEEMKRIFAESSNRERERLPKPAWITSADTLYKTFTEYNELLEYGEIHYACLVQANTILFKTFPRFNCPADIIISVSDYYDIYPFELGEIAEGLYSYKNKNNAPDSIKKITDSITDEYERLYNIELPYSLTNSKPVFFTTIIVFRKHLPGQKLIGSIFPVITNPARFQTSIILPKKYWTKEFINIYKGKY